MPARFAARQRLSPAMSSKVSEVFRLINTG